MFQFANRDLLKAADENDGNLFDNSFDIKASLGHLLTSSSRRDIKIYSKGVMKPQILPHQSKPVCLHIFREARDYLFVILQSGELFLWEYSDERLEWKTKASAWLQVEHVASEQVTRVHVTNATVSDIFGLVQWCQKKDEGVQTTFTVYSRTWRIDDVQGFTMGQIVMQIVGAPESCLLYNVHKNLVVWPSEASPPGVFLQWRPLVNTMDVLHTDLGLVSSIANRTGIFTYRDLMMKAVHCWGQLIVPRPRIFGCPDANSLLLLDTTQVPCRVKQFRKSDNEAQLVTCDVIKMAALDLTQAEFCYCRNVVFVAVTHIIHVFDVHSGRLIQTLNIASGERVVKLAPCTGNAVRVLAVTASRILDIGITSSHSRQHQDFGQLFNLYEGISEPWRLEESPAFSDVVKALAADRDDVTEPFLQQFKALQVETLSILGGDT